MTHKTTLTAEESRLLNAKTDVDNLIVAAGRDLARSLASGRYADDEEGDAARLIGDSPAMEALMDAGAVLRHLVQPEVWGMVFGPAMLDECDPGTYAVLDQVTTLLVAEIDRQVKPGAVPASEADVMDTKADVVQRLVTGAICRAAELARITELAA